MKSYILKNVDDELWWRIKVLVAKRKTTIKELIVRLLWEEANKERDEST